MTNTDFTVADVLEWARTKPAGERYSYGSNTNCAICQFLRETKRAAHPTVGGYTWSTWAEAPYSGERTRRSIPCEIADALAGSFDRTFGGLVTALEALCPETPVTQSDWLTIDAYLEGIEPIRMTTTHSLEG